MKLSFDWLSDYVDLSGITPQELADKLTMGAFEVEEVNVVGADLQGPLVIGEIMEIHPHPNADKIRLTKTRVAPGADPLEIVCGAQNIEVGQFVPVALPGAKVVDRKTGGSLAIKASAIRGVHSNGMLCSPSELGIADSDPEAGILILDRETMQSKIGQDAREILSLMPDHVLTVEPRSNRGDALSVMGLAREVAALLNRPLKEPAWSIREDKDASAKARLKTSIEQTDDCAFLSVRIIDKIEQGKLPSYITKRLAAIGLRSVSPVVDITNYVMHEMGQPLHAYDFEKIEGGEINARRAREGETIETLDGKKRSLTTEMLVIADAKKVVGVAGVMGSKDSEISDSTKIIALESASFAQAKVRRGSRLLGLSSDASLRFERGVDPVGCRKASDRASYLISKYCSSGSDQTVGEIATTGSDVAEAKTLKLRLAQLKRMIGLEFTAAQVKELITPLGFTVTDSGTETGSGNEEVSVTVPSFRQTDVTREIDLVEEVCRLWGYERVPLTMPAATIAAEPLDPTFFRLRQSLAAWGFSEAWLSSLTGPAILGIAAETNEELVRVLNPLSVEHQVLRDSLLPGLVQSAAYNYSRGRKKVWLFEIGRTYLRSDVSPFGTGVIEPNTLGAVLIGDQEESNWQGAKSALDIYGTKGYVSNLLALLKVDPEKIRFAPAENPPEIFHPGKTVEISFSHRPISLSDDRKVSEKSGNGKEGAVTQAADNTEKVKKPDSIYIGRFGELHPRKADSEEIRSAVFLLELNLDAIKPLSRGKSFKETSNTPAVFRDITADLPEHITYAAVRSCILAEGGQILKDVELVSTFKPQEKVKSLSFRLRLQHADKTMTAEEIDKLIDKVKAGLSKRLGATYR
jgi:phenylalanyl-tRNA synthetase beta chain